MQRLKHRPSMLAPAFLAASVLALFAVAHFNSTAQADEPTAARPNILWISCEDISPLLGCYGDDYATTPNIDRLAKEGVRYANAFAPIGVCAPARSSLITGMYASSLGTQLMRCQGKLPKDVRCFPAYLRGAGYYCTNNSKTDYNFPVPADAWDKNGSKADWRARPDGRPFFSVVNFTGSHESFIRMNAKREKFTASLSKAERHDPAKAPLPPYHPDAPETRLDWARHYDTITAMDKQVGKLLKRLDDEGLADDTIVFFFSDHGSGMPRSKRWLYDTSLRVPMIVRFPKKYARYQQVADSNEGAADGAKTNDGLNEQHVNFVDFGATVLTLAGVEVPAHMQGRSFLDGKSPAERTFGFRDRMDERYDLIRCVHDGRYKYIRNFRPDLPYFGVQHLNYAMEMPTLALWQKLADEGKLSGPAATFMAKGKPVEELYDLQNDPWEIHNLAADPRHHETVVKMRRQLREWMLSIRDLGLLPEGDMRTRFGKRAPYAAVRGPDGAAAYPMEAILDAALLATEADPKSEARLVEMLGAKNDRAIRYWGALGLGLLPDASDKRIALLRRTAESAAEPPTVRMAAAEALCRLQCFEPGVAALQSLMSDENDWVRLYAVNALDRIGDHARSALPQFRAGLNDSYEYVQRICIYATKKFAE